MCLSYVFCRYMCMFYYFRALLAATSKDLKRYYFGTLRINTSRIILSVLSSTDLPQDLKVIKRSVGFPLVKFEDAKVELGMYNICIFIEVYLL